MSDFLSFQLTDDFIEPYSALKPDWGFSIGGGNFLSELVYVNKYSALKDDGSKEQWYETCRRCVEGMYSILKDHCKKNKTPWNDLKAQKSARDAYDRMFHFKWTPPGRGLQHMGREAIHSRQDSSFLQNCFAGNELFITLEYGPTSFAEVLGQEIHVLTENGYQPAVVQEFGVQNLQDVTFKPYNVRSNHRVTVRVTPDHRWILSNDTETLDLKVGDVAQGNIGNIELNDESYYRGIQHGLIFGDGVRITHRYRNDDWGYEIRGCDDRVRQMIIHPEVKSLWDGINYDRPSANGDPIAKVRTHRDLKDFPLLDDYPEYKRGFIDGWLTADASIAGLTYKLASQHPHAEEWLRLNAAEAGYSITGVNFDSVTTTNFGERKNPMRRISLVASKINWTVESIVPLDEPEPVFCAVVPSTGRFTLASGIYTGNCAFLTTAKLSAHSVWEATGPFTRMMEMSMCVDGDTWVMTTEGPRKIKEIDMPMDLFVSGEKHAAPHGAWPTGVKDTVLIETEEGYAMRLTGDHRVRTVSYGRTTNNRVTESFEWVEAGQLKPNDKIVLSDQYGIDWFSDGSWDEGYLTGACLGDGWKNTTSFVVAAYKKDSAYESIKTQALSSVANVSRRAIAGGWTEKNKDCDTLTIGTWVGEYLDVSPKMMRDKIEQASKEFYQGFLRGLFDADGGVTIAGKSNIVSLSQSNLDTLQRVQRMLLRLGIKSNIQVKRAESTPTTILGVDTVSGPAWTLVISSDAILRFADVVGFSDGPKSEALQTLTEQDFYHSYMNTRVKSVLPAGETLTYDISVPSLEAFDANGLYVHNCGIGVGFDTRGANNLALHEPSLEKKDIFVVEDSREGWAEAIGVLLESYFFKNRNYVEFDYTQIRPSGALLKSFGGRASGPQPLIDCIERVRFLLGEREGEKLTSRDIVDVMNLIGKAVVAGGARRSAQIAFGSVDDDDYTSIKDWTLPENQLRTDPDHGWAWNSNNSVFVEGEIPKELIDKTVLNGEPGYMWLDLAQQYGRMVDPPNGADYRAMGGNPCLTGDTWVLTVDGPRQIIDLVDDITPLVFQGSVYESSGFWKTGTKPVLRLEFSDGRHLRLTDNHLVMTEDDDWVEAGNLQIGDRVKVHDHKDFSWDGKGSIDEGYVTGLFLGDGSYQGGRATLCVWDQDEGAETIKVEAERIVRDMGFGPTFKGWGGPFGNGWHRLSTKALSDTIDSWGLVQGNKHITKELEERASSDFIKGFLRGLFDADGSVQGTQTKGVSIRLGQSNLSDIQAVQRMLARIGINSTIYPRQEERIAKLPDGHGGYGDYVCKPTWDIIIAKNNIQKFASRVGFTHSVKADKLATAIAAYKRTPNADLFVTTLVSVAEDGVEDVYDVTVDTVSAFDANGLVVHNCLEQTLEPWECCTLVETFPTKHTDFSDYRETLKAAYLYGKAVTLLPTAWPETNEVMARNRRIGCSMSGDAEFVETRSWAELQEWQDEGYKFINHRDKKYSEWLAVRESIKKTSIKPSGTVSLVAAVTPGVHWPVSAGSHIRRVRYSVNDPLVAKLEDAGYPVEPMIGDPKNTVVVTFITQSAPIRDERSVSIWEKAELAVMAQRWWADNQVSATVTFLPSEEGQIAPLLASKKGQIKGISFLPLRDDEVYPQAPYERISEEDAQKMLSKVKHLKGIYKKGQEASGDKFCDNDSCTI